MKKYLGLILAVLIIFSAIILYQKLFLNQSKITTYEECIKAKGSLIQPMYPPICVTKNGLRFTQEVTPPLTKAEECYEQVTNVKCPEGTVCMSNPASSFCVCMGGSLEIKTDETGGQYGICKVDGNEYEEWEYFRTMSPKQNIAP